MKDLILAAILSAICLLLFFHGIGKVAKEEDFLARHRHPEDIRRKRREKPDFYGIPIIVDPNVPSDSFYLVEVSGVKTILVNDADTGLLEG